MTAPPAENRTTRADRKAELAIRRAAALRMRTAGATWEEIAVKYGYTETQARNDVMRCVRESVRVPAEQLLDRQRAIINDVIRVEYPAALDPSSPRHYEAQAKLLEFLQHEAKLTGMYAPTRVNVGISEEEFTRQAAELLAVTGQGPLLELVRDSPVAADATVVEAEVDESWSNL